MTLVEAGRQRLRDRGRIDREVEAGRERLRDRGRVDRGGGREREAERQS